MEQYSIQAKCHHKGSHPKNWTLRGKLYLRNDIYIGEGTIPNLSEQHDTKKSIVELVAMIINKRKSMLFQFSKNNLESFMADFNFDIKKDFGSGTLYPLYMEQSRAVPIYKSIQEMNTAEHIPQYAAKLLENLSYILGSTIYTHKKFLRDGAGNISINLDKFK